jgi:hypothetical protein
MKKNLIIILIVVLLVFLLGFLIGFKWTGKCSVNLISPDNTFQAGWEAAKKRLAESGFMPPAVKQKTLYGEVKEVKDSEIVIKVKPLEPLASSDLDERIVKIDANTKIYFLEMKHEEERERLLKEVDKVIQETKNPTTPGESPVVSTPPSFFNKNAAIFNDIKVDSKVTIVAVDDDVKSVKSFIAAEVLIQPSACGTPTCQTAIHP